MGPRRQRQRAMQAVPCRHTLSEQLQASCWHTALPLFPPPIQWLVWSLLHAITVQEVHSPGPSQYCARAASRRASRSGGLADPAGPHRCARFASQHAWLSGAKSLQIVLAALHLLLIPLMMRCRPEGVACLHLPARFLP